ncbi:MAG: ferritin-like protein [Xanthomonadales bacterium]|nr:ferritin-like protein [Xanthomonadales bacterium]
MCPVEPIASEDLLHRLRQQLQRAVELEFSTLPPYLTALYSIKEGSNQYATSVIRSIAIEEMFHMTNAANVLIAIGGKPSTTHKGFVPRYPVNLPDGEVWFKAELRPFSRSALEVFREIEMPAELVPEKGDITIGDFYGQIENTINSLVELMGDDLFQIGDPEHQVDSKYFYGAEGVVEKVRDKDSAMFALNSIIAQGEGAPNSAWNPSIHFPDNEATGIESGDAQLFQQAEELAHYYRFDELYRGRHYQHGDTPQSGPTGPSIDVDYHNVYPIIVNPCPKQYPKATPLYGFDHDFNVIFSQLLDTLQLAFNGEPQRLVTAVDTMFSLKYKAQQMMRIAIPNDSQGRHAAPTWQYLKPEHR